MSMVPPPRLLAGLVALLAAVGLAAGSALPAAAATGAPHRVQTYVALGDSYAAGQAVNCTHTASSYPLRLDALHRVKLLRNATCASATTSIVVRSQLEALTPGVRLVTVTVGANDLNLTGLAAVCGANPSSSACLGAVQARQAELPTLYRRLVATYSAIAGESPRAQILVTGYPPLVSSGPVAVAQRALNDTIRAAVAAVRGCVHIRYVDVSFAGHTLDTTDSWFVRTGPNAFHPNAAGDAAIAAALRAALGLRSGAAH